ncbi:MAG: hypothetical protein ACFFG0_55615 [Candidatus Thorarchaeota archaeon]
MRKKENLKKKNEIHEIIGSETVLEKIRRKIPWIFGNWIRKPKIRFPKFRIKRLSIPTSSSSLILIIILVILFILQTGIIYLIIRKPPAVGVDSNGNPIFIWLEDINEAFIIESIVSSILILLFSSGFVLLYHASKYMYNKIFAYRIIIIALVLIFVIFFLLQKILDLKTPKKF